MVSYLLVMSIKSMAQQCTSCIAVYLVAVSDYYFSDGQTLLLDFGLNQARLMVPQHCYTTHQ